MQQPPKQQSVTKSAIIALGSNLASRFGPPEINVLRAIDQISFELGDITGKSRLFVTPCFPDGSGPDFVNAVIVVKATLPSRKVLELLHKIEADFGRTREERWGPRTLDLDLLDVNAGIEPDKPTFITWRSFPLKDQKTQTPAELILPHPRIQDRAFVLIPLAEAAPDWVHPVLKQTAQEILLTLPKVEVAAVVPLRRAEDE